MTPEQVLQQPPTVLTPAQRRFYFENGYLLCDRLLNADLLAELRTVTDEFVECSRGISESDDMFELAPDHSADAPRLRRLHAPDEQHPVYWRAISGSILADVAADLVGADVKFHHSKLNFKWSHGGDEVKWHQDIVGWPHTNYSPLTMGIYLYDCGPEQAPLGVIPGSHDGPLYDQYDDQGHWIGCLREEDQARVPLDRAVYLSGAAGSVTIHNSRTLHGSARNQSDIVRPLLLMTFSSADAFAYTPHFHPSTYAGAIVRGKPARWARHDPRPCLIPPDPRKGWVSLFAYQQGERVADASGEQDPVAAE